MKRILFVDDEPKVLDGLKRMLYGLRHEWGMVFVGSSLEALRELSESEFDVVVTDVRMPGMTGLELLKEVVKRHPQIVRMVLSGTAEQEVALPSVMLAHQYLNKPCDPVKLREAVERAFNLRIMLNNPELKQVVSRIQSLPSIPIVYTQLIEALQNPDTSLKEIGRIIGQDLAMTAKILQVVNSAFFGVQRHITDPIEAVTYLGADTVKALALTVSVFSQFDTRRVRGFSIETLRDRGMVVATLARQIAKSLHLSKSELEDAFLGGLLHELGKLILACNYPEQYEEVIHATNQRHIPAREVELEVFGTTHAEVGAYLLWLWGLPDAVAEVVAHYQKPAVARAPGALIAVHVAHALSSEEPEQNVDLECLTTMGLIDHLPAWKQMHDEALSGRPAC